MRVILFLLLILSTYATCPETSEEAFIDTVEVRKSLLDCTFDQLGTHYKAANCCIDSHDAWQPVCNTVHAVMFIKFDKQDRYKRFC